jgi:hypothetical protein
MSHRVVITDSSYPDASFEREEIGRASCRERVYSGV